MTGPLYLSRDPEARRMKRPPRQYVDDALRVDLGTARWWRSWTARHPTTRGPARTSGLEADCGTGSIPVAVQVRELGGRSSLGTARSSWLSANYSAAVDVRKVHQQRHGTSEVAAAPLACTSSTKPRRQQHNGLRSTARVRAQVETTQTRTGSVSRTTRLACYFGSLQQRR
jgi:hypothetical protein